MHLTRRHIDSAQMYRNEAEVGEAVRESGVPREQIFISASPVVSTSSRACGLIYVDVPIASKINSPDYGYERTLAAVDRSLKRFQFGECCSHLPHLRQIVVSRVAVKLTWAHICTQHQTTST